MPSKAQASISACKTRPDFLYEAEMTAIYIDGPHHLYPDRAQRDASQTECLEDFGYSVIRFDLQSNWETVLQQYPHVFGVAQSMSLSTVVDQSRSTTSLDLDLFDPVWHGFIQALAEIEGIAIEAGGDVMQDGQVIGSFIAEVAQNGAIVRLIDSNNSDTPLVQQALQAQGYKVLAVEQQVTNPTVVLQALGEDY